MPGKIISREGMMGRSSRIDGKKTGDVLPPEGRRVVARDRRGRDLHFFTTMVIVLVLINEIKV